MEPSDFLTLWDYEIIPKDDIDELMKNGGFHDYIRKLGLAGWNVIAKLNGCLLLKRPIMMSEELQEMETLEDIEPTSCRGCIHFTYDYTLEGGRDLGWCKEMGNEVSSPCKLYKSK